jgi:hypothetical protein
VTPVGSDGTSYQGYQWKRGLWRNRGIMLRIRPTHLSSTVWARKNSPWASCISCGSISFLDTMQIIKLIKA